MGFHTNSQGPFLSILICSRDRRLHLEPLAARIKEIRSRFPFEIVVVEETDSPRPIEGVRYVPHPVKNLGIPYARNLALQAAQGEIIVFMDDDCHVSDGWLDNLIPPFQDDAVVGVQGEVTVPPSASSIGWAETLLGFPGGGITRIAGASGRDCDTSEISTQNCAYRKWVLDRISGFDERLRRDREDDRLAKRACSFGRCLFVPKAVVSHEPQGTLGKVWQWFVRRGEADIDWIKTGHQKGKDLKAMLKGPLAAKLILVYVIGLLLNLAFLFLPGFILLYGALQHKRFFRPWKVSGAATRALLVLPLVKLTMDLALDWGRLRGVLLG